VLAPNAPSDPDDLARELPYLKHAERVQVASDTLTCAQARVTPPAHR
jgi:hypothetical protein